jgi:hypothetical protein
MAAQKAGQKPKSKPPATIDDACGERIRASRVLYGHAGPRGALSQGIPRSVLQRPGRRSSEVLPARGGCAVRSRSSDLYANRPNHVRLLAQYSARNARTMPMDGADNLTPGAVHGWVDRERPIILVAPSPDTKARGATPEGGKEPLSRAPWRALIFRGAEHRRPRGAYPPYSSPAVGRDQSSPTPGRGRKMARKSRVFSCSKRTRPRGRPHVGTPRVLGPHGAASGEPAARASRGTPLRPRHHRSAQRPPPYRSSSRGGQRPLAESAKGSRARTESSRGGLALWGVGSRLGETA